MYNAMMLSRDGAEIYSCCKQVATGTRIHHNWIHDTTAAVGGLGDAYSLSGITFDNGSTGFVVDQNVLWNNQRFNIHVFGASLNSPNSSYIHNNTIPDSSPDGVIFIEAVADCAAMKVVDNRVVLGLRSIGNSSSCTFSNNNSQAPGASDMTLSTEVGCNFDGCSSDPPPGIVSNTAVTPCPVTSASSPNPQ